MYTLYTLPGSCSTGIAVLLEKLGVDYRLVPRGDVADYMKIVPTNQVPALVTEGGKVIAEGAAIALYLLEKHDNDMLSKDPELRADFYQWLNFDYSTLHPAYSRIFVAVFKADLPDEAKTKLSVQMAAGVSGLWAILNERMANQRFVLGDKPSHPDYMAAVYATWNSHFPQLDIVLGENVKRWLGEVYELPEFVAAYAKEGVAPKKPF